MRVPYELMYSTLVEKLMKYGAGEDIARRCAKNLTETSCNGVYSHGLNRFPRIISMIGKGIIRLNETASCVQSMGSLEVWDGKLGMGNTNAALCMDRAVALAGEHGIGCVALRHTNHWQRGGAFGIQAAEAGCVGICWTTTQPNMPAWGAKDRRIGNNPLILCLPYGGSYVMVDGAMAQFSYGAIESARLAGKQLPVAGGFDESGNLTTDPAAIEKTWRVLPIGFWKGSGFSILMDMIASVLAEGKTISEIGQQGDTPEDEYNLNQVFIAVKVKDRDGCDSTVEKIIGDIKASSRVEEGMEILYPCEKEQRLYEENSRLGIPVNEAIWTQVQAL